MNSVEIRYDAPENEIENNNNNNNNISYVVGVRNTNARVVANCTLKIFYPGVTPKMTPQVPKTIKPGVPKSTIKPRNFQGSRIRGEFFSCRFGLVGSDPPNHLKFSSYPGWVGSFNGTKVRLSGAGCGKSFARLDLYCFSRQ
jgi:hypothetical protein